MILLLGATIVAYSGYSELQAQGILTLEDLRANTTNSDHGDLVSMVQSDGDYRFIYILLGSPSIGLWYWCSDQTIVQRVLGAKQLSDAQLGPIFAGFIKILPVPLFVFPGVVAAALYKDEVGEVSDMAIFVLIKNLISTPGLKGLICAAMLSALMSTVAGALNSVATLVSVDICKQLKPDISDSGLVMIGRVVAAVVLLLSVGWSTQVTPTSQLPFDATALLQPVALAEPTCSHSPMHNGMHSCCAFDWPADQQVHKCFRGDQRHVGLPDTTDLGDLLARGALGICPICDCSYLSRSRLMPLLTRPAGLQPRGTHQAAIVTLGFGFVLGMTIFVIDFQTKALTGVRLQGALCSHTLLALS